MSSTDLDAIRRPTLGIGTITPSGNVVVERVTTAILAAFPAVSGHFTRIPVVGTAGADGQGYDGAAMRQAATLLAHARPAALVWNGSKGGSLGFDVDRDLCRDLAARTGVPCTTATLAIEAALRANGQRRVALVTPFTAAYVQSLVPHFAAAGFEVVAEAHAGHTENMDFATVPDAAITAMARTVAAARPDAILTYCTNFPAAHLVPGLEQALGIAVYDSASASVWGALRLAGQATGAGRGWGGLFGQDLDLLA